MALGLVPAGAARAQEPDLKTLRFESVADDFPNPERGFYRYRELSQNDAFDIRKDNNSLVFLKLRADAFRGADLSQAFLDQFDQAFQAARKAGVKLIPRLAYNDGPEAGCPAQYGCDAPKAVVMRHIAQLAPVWKKNKDALDLVDPGFIGGWGEWHTSSNHLDNTKDMTDILFAILDSLPADRMAYVRYPSAKRNIFFGSAAPAALGHSQAFNGSRLARVGHFNDCFLSSEDDVGTYRNIADGWTRMNEIGYIGGESRFTPYGGETCALHDRGGCANALMEMAILHIDHLNRDYQPEVIQRWKDQGCYDTIAIKLGYRFIMDSASLPDSVRPGGVLRMEISLRNDGFGELFNPRDVEAHLLGPGGTEVAAVLPEDPRFWSGGTTVHLSERLSIPASLPEGKYTLGLRLADKSPSLRGDPRYSVRFANKGVWNQGTGINELKSDLTISARARGASDPGVTAFAPLGPSVSVRPILAGNPAGASAPFRLRAFAGRLEIRGERSAARAGAAGEVTAELRTLNGTLERRWIRDREPGEGARGGKAADAEWSWSIPAPLRASGMFILTVRSGGAQASWRLLAGPDAPGAVPR